MIIIIVIIDPLPGPLPAREEAGHSSATLRTSGVGVLSSNNHPFEFSLERCQQCKHQGETTLTIGRTTN